MVWRGSVCNQWRYVSWVESPQRPDLPTSVFLLVECDSVVWRISGKSRPRLVRGLDVTLIPQVVWYGGTEIYRTHAINQSLTLPSTTWDRRSTESYRLNLVGPDKEKTGEERQRWRRWIGFVENHQMLLLTRYWSERCKRERFPTV